MTKVATKKIIFEKIFLCRGFTNSPIDIHEPSLELSHLFGTTSLDSCLIQNYSFYWKLRKMWTDQDMVAYYLRKWDFDSKDSKWIFFKIDFQMDLLRKIFYFKIKYFSQRIPLKIYLKKNSFRVLRIKISFFLNNMQPCFDQFASFSVFNKSYGFEWDMNPSLWSQ